MKNKKTNKVNFIDLRASFYDDEFCRIWKNRDNVSMREYMRSIDITYEELEVYSVGDCVIFYNCKVKSNKKIPKFLSIV
ncbi:MAG: hypothetical protein ACRC7R_01410 [Sarcina sp.]